MGEKKPTKAQLENRIKNAIVFVPKVKDTFTIYFSDKGLRLTVTEPDDYNGYAVIETRYHRHVFDELNPNTGNGSVLLPISRPWLYTKRVIELANKNLKDIEVDGGYSFQKLLEVLKAKEDELEYLVINYYYYWCSVIFDGLYSISENAAGQFLVYFKFLSIIATNAILLEEHKEDMTNKQFVENFIKNIKDFTTDMDEYVLFHALTDEERVKQELDAIQKQEQEQAMEAQVNENQD